MMLNSVHILNCASSRSNYLAIGRIFISKWFLKILLNNVCFEQNKFNIVSSRSAFFVIEYGLNKIQIKKKDFLIIDTLIIYTFIFQQFWCLTRFWQKKISKTLSLRTILILAYSCFNKLLNRCRMNALLILTYIF